MGNIVVLDELTINQIAAGEVVERPASVIKEMVENSIDAGATNISVEIRNGGISYIRITDNGKGINSDDMELAFERHATSKIRTANDLNTITSMGFRGEALASIAAIARVEMISKTPNNAIGNRIVVEGGIVLEQEEVGCGDGTIITVENLFYNTPVRYKFLKKDYTESGYIEDAITRLALVNPNIAFKLINSGKTIIQTPGNGNIKDVIYAIYGKDIANGILDVDYQYQEIHVSGVVGKPEIARSNRGNQTFFVNKRYVKDKTLSGAAENSFKGLLPIGKYGFLILNIEMSPSKVDVNVHPSKIEVRFQEESIIFKAVYHAIKDTLLKAELIANTEKTSIDDEDVKIQPQKSNGFVDLFRKISNSQENKEEAHNIIQEIYNKSLGQELNTEKENTVIGSSNTEKLFCENKINTLEDEEDLLINKEPINSLISENQDQIVEKNEIMESSTISSETPKEERLEIFQKLMDMQKQLQAEVENNPNINTTIDSIMQNTKAIEENYNKTEKMPEEILTIENTTENIQEKELNQIQETTQLEANYNNGEFDFTQTPEYKQAQEFAQSYDRKQLQDNTEYMQNTASTKDMEDTQQIQQSQLKDAEIVSEATPTQQNDEIAQDTINIEDIKDKLNELESTGEASPEFVNMYQRTFGKLPATAIEKQKEEEKKINAYDIIKNNNISVFEEIEEYKKIKYKFVGIVFKTYIILEIGNEMYILDQHAAHERIMYEKVKANYYSEEDKDSQLLLLPDIITLSHKEMAIAQDNMEMFEKAGFMVEEFGENTMKLSGVPNICVELDTKELFLETLDEINTVARTAKQEIEEKFIATVACKAAVKANMALTQEEVDSLMEELLKLPNPFTCPHGRPTAIKMDKVDIEKKFARR